MCQARFDLSRKNITILFGFSPYDRTYSLQHPATSREPNSIISRLDSAVSISTSHLYSYARIYHYIFLIHQWLRLFFRRNMPC